MEIQGAFVECTLDIPHVTEHASLALGAVYLLSEIKRTDDEVLCRGDNGSSGRRGQDVVGREHQHAGLGLRLRRKREVNSHLVTVEVGIEGRADERMDLDRLTLDEHRLERLNTETVKRWRTVEHHRMLLDDVLENVPHLRAAPFHHALGGLDVLGQFEVYQALHHEGFEELESHQLGQAALMQLEHRTGNDDRTTGVVHSLAEEVLAEATLLTLQHVRQGLERAVAGTRYRATATAVVEQRVNGLLQHALLVVHDDLGSTEIQQALQAVVPVDHAAVQVIEVAGSETAAVQLHHRA
uniref:Unannotated protein n=1 Tax=freshwater metagenome TaxID=449393 RepID=A0A6J7MSC4_9ZZZZ